MNTSPTPTDLAVCFGLSKAQGAILALLMKGGVVTNAMVQDELDGDTPARILVHRLRAVLVNQKIDISSRRGIGYWLDPEDLGKAWGKWSKHNEQLHRNANQDDGGAG